MIKKENLRGETKHMGSECSLNRSRQSKLIVASTVTLATVMTLAYPTIPAKVHATGITHNWVRQNNKLDPNGGWYGGVAVSADSSVMLSSVMYGNVGEQLSPLYLSRNNGTSWQDIAADIDENVTSNWQAVDVSDDGEVMVAGSSYSYDYDSEETDAGRIYISEDGGDSWSNITPENGDGPVGDWRHLVVSGDGSRIVALSHDDYENVYISDDAGDSWDVMPVDDSWTMGGWETLAVSDDGGKIIFGGESWETGTDQLYLSDDDGTTWDNISPDIEGWEFQVEAAMDADGDKIVAAVVAEDESENVHGIFVSENDGAGWTNVTPDTEEDPVWGAVTLADDGSMLVALDAWNGNVFMSNTDGTEWDTIHPGEEYDDDTIDWFSADLNSDGSRFIGTGGEEVYTAALGAQNDDGEDEGQVVSFSNAEDSKTVVLTLPSGTTVTCHSPVKESGLVVQDNAYAYPLGLVDFCFSGADESNDIAIIFVTDLKPNQVVVRKYNPTNKSYATVAGASVTETTYNGQHALRVTYTIIDNGPLDTDPDEGEIADPVGLGVLGVGSPNTGLSSSNIETSSAGIFIAGTLALALTGTSRLRQKITRKFTTIR